MYRFLGVLHIALSQPNFISRTCYICINRSAIVLYVMKQYVHNLNIMIYMSVFVCLHIHKATSVRARLYVYVGVGITVCILKLIFKGKSDYSWWHVYKAYS